MPAGVLDYVFSFFAPMHCLLCKTPVGAKEILCPTCLAAWNAKPIRRSLRLREGRLLATASPFVYAGRYRRTILEYKFHNQTAYAKPLGWFMSGAASVLPGPFDFATFVPANPHAERDYNQSQLLAKHLGKALGIPVAATLERTRETRAQHDLRSRMRKANVEGAFRARTSLAGKRVLLVDDIVTTGGTLSDCARALYEGGAAQVCGLCAADAKRAPVKITIDRGESQWIGKKYDERSGIFWKR